MKTFVKGLRRVSGRHGSPSPPSKRGIRFGMSLTPGGGDEISFESIEVEVKVEKASTTFSSAHKFGNRQDTLF